jgi:soluble lytic murein transglycosylase-like protein
MKTAVSAVKSLLIKDTTALFLGAALVSSYATVVALSYHNSNGFAPSRAAVASAQSPAELSRSYRSHVSFVSTIIKTNAPKLPTHDQLAQLIVDESTRASLDPLFVAAVIRSESMFRTTALSNKGAKGLMQIMPETAEYISKIEKISLKGGSASLNDPRTNVRLGVAYLKYLDKMFGGDRERILIAYNWGPANLSQSLKGKRTLPRQSVNYAREIIKQHRQWKSSLQEVAFDGSRLAAVRAMVG